MPRVAVKQSIVGGKGATRWGCSRSRSEKKDQGNSERGQRGERHPFQCSDISKKGFPMPL